MPKEIISASIEYETAKAIREMAKKEKRSFSNMTDILLQEIVDLKKQETTD